MTKLKLTSKITPYVLLAPAAAVVPNTFHGLSINDQQHDDMLAEMQIMRGGVALAEGAVRPEQLGCDKRHRMVGDENSWHILRMGANGNILGCVRILEHMERPEFASLRVSKSALALSEEWGTKVQAVVEKEIDQACCTGAKVVEPGGWVLDETLRGSTEAVSIALSVFAWSQLIGDRLGYVTATSKHKSSSMLRRLGARGLECEGQTFPKYYDPAYDCEMELLRFSTKGLNPRFEGMMAPLRAMLAESPVVQAKGAQITLTRLAA